MLGSPGFDESMNDSLDFSQIFQDDGGYEIGNSDTDNDFENFLLSIDKELELEVAFHPQQTNSCTEQPKEKNLKRKRCEMGVIFPEEESSCASVDNMVQILSSKSITVQHTIDGVEEVRLCTLLDKESTCDRYDKKRLKAEFNCHQMRHLHNSMSSLMSEGSSIDDMVYRGLGSSGPLLKIQTFPLDFIPCIGTQTKCEEESEIERCINPKTNVASKKRNLVKSFSDFESKFENWWKSKE